MDCEFYQGEVEQFLESLRPDLGCPTEGCKGDKRYAAPGRGHNDGCTYMRPPLVLTQNKGSVPIKKKGRRR